MLLSTVLGGCAAAFALSLSVAVLVHERRSLARWCFCGGMILLAAQALLGTWSLGATSPQELHRWLVLSWVAESMLAGPWLCFSLIYSRGNHSEFLTRWRLPLVLSAILPIGIAILFRSELIQITTPPGGEAGVVLTLTAIGKALNLILLLVAVVILTNLEKTFRAAVGTMQWRIKFLILGLGVIFGVRIYTRTQGLLYSGLDLHATAVEAGALFVGCGLIAISYMRRGFAGVEVYPSRTVLQQSVTILLVGGYLFILGVLAQVTAVFGGAASFQLQSLLVLIGIVVLAIMLLSRRVRQAINRTVSRHFKRPEHDAYAVWTGLTRSLAQPRSSQGLCSAAGKLLSETFAALSVTIWLADDKSGALTLFYSTAQPGNTKSAPTDSSPANLLPPAPSTFTAPFDLESATGEWAEHLREINRSLFQHGGKRICVPLVAADRTLGMIVLGDRVNGTPYTPEEMDLLKCIGDQVAAGLLNLQLAEELLAAKELEALQAISTFFVHDLKNATSGLNLILKNLPIHFDDPEFRADTLRAVGNTINRIGNLTDKLGVLRHKIELKLAKCDLKQLVSDSIASLNGMPDIVLEMELQSVPEIMGDPEQLHTVMTNLLLNARDAVGPGGRVIVESLSKNSMAMIVVRDHGCGMSPAFLRDSLFRPFSTTKKKGMGIGMFQSRMIIEAHRGTLVAESTEGVGSTFRVTLPVNPAQ